ncbi:complex I NDUFA9 subunit family protein [Halomarina ordinaria]|uniref:Complex I NDUFA9 subunit family protein n=1 Tax=Halomarina ordinaria TaxID=3033939 RepID=A0ABD5UHV7_9EURY|nr:complex I NDUFA9 subunit family protein [Halomarina sp. PSRA2]
MNVLVVGGTGFIGTELSRELTERDHEVTVLSRSPDDEGLPAGVDTYEGDVTDYDSIEEAFVGQDAVVYLVALSPLFKPDGGNAKHFDVHLGGAENVVKAMQAHDVERLVHMSALGADPRGETAYLQAKGQAEETVRDAGLDVVVFRPSVVFGDGGEFVPFTKKLAPRPAAPLPGGGKTKFQPIHVGDLVPMLAEAVEDDDRVGDTYDVGGPEVLTLKQVAELAHRADGHSFTAIPIPMAFADVGLSMLGAVGGPMGRDQARSLRIDNTVADNDVTAFGVDEGDLTTLREYLGLEERATA